MSKIIVSNEYRDAKADDMEEIKKLIANVHGDDRKLEHSQLIVACSGNKIVGCIRTVQAEEDCKEIASLVVDPKYRGGGVGSQLLQRILKKDSSRPLYLICTKDKQSFYERNGLMQAQVHVLPATLARDYKTMQKDNSDTIVMIASK